MTRRKNGNSFNDSESLVKTGAVPTVPAVPAVFLDESLTRARVRACAHAHVDTSKVSGNSGNSGNTSSEVASSKAIAPVPTFSEGASPSGNSGNTALHDPASLDAALRLPVRRLAWLPARVTYRLSHALGPVVWTTHPRVYEALRGSQAVFSPREFEAAVAAGESGHAVSREFAAWVAQKLASPTWRLGTEDALRWGPRERLVGFGWWDGAAWCAGHDIHHATGWTVGFACAVFALTPVSVEVHPAEEVTRATAA